MRSVQRRSVAAARTPFQAAGHPGAIGFTEPSHFARGRLTREAHARRMKLRTIIATATTAAVLSTGGVALAGATTGGGSSPSDHPAAATVAVASRRHPVLRHRARHHLRRVLHRACGIVAETVGIDRKELRTELRSGKTIAEIATAHGVDPQTVVDALVDAANQRVDRAAANGRITAERAAKIKERLPERITRLVNEWIPRRVRAGTDA